MSRNKNKKRNGKPRDAFGIEMRPETKKSITAILLVGLSILLMLAAFSKAGPLGDVLFRGLVKFFGWGYYLLPSMALLVAILFFLTREEKFFRLTFIGAGLSIIFGLGIIDLFLPEQGGWVGNLVGALEIPFGKIAATILMMTFALISLLITFNISLLLAKKTPEDDEEPEMPDHIVIKAPEELPKGKMKEKKDESEETHGETEPEEIEPVIAEPKDAKRRTGVVPRPHKNYVPPPISLLKSSTEKPTSGDLRANANIIKRTLESFGIPVEMSEINIGPKVTRYTLKPAEGVKLTRITALSPDLSLALAAHPIRIEAPIPGKSLVGIEVPNKSAALVRLGNLMGYEGFAHATQLVFPLGRDVSGEAIFVDIEKMPHLLVAGSTGSGKSITIHSMLTSLLYKNGPENLKLILIDPKRVELSVYEGIPHLVSPVITEAKKSVGVFRWAIAEMERRYETLLKASVRDIKSYNKNHKDEPLPYIVIVVDEMADLMASYGRDVESSIVRLAQMARATGIHLILSTQRPSVEVITGLIKANITGRIALQVASQIDSRTILDMSGAEKLLGGGDLLFVSGELSKPKRVQCAYISEEEVRNVTDFIRDNNEPIIETAEDASEAIQGMTPEPRDNKEVFDEYMESDDDDDLYGEAVQIVKEAEKASASLLQRRLKVGYARAARLLDIMEAKGVVGPGDGAKPREILIDKEGV